ncbi:hypothetical protein LWI28_027589 [Acer negundo]|uniref:Retrotransposon gag domain-containing protein n=1 Tax=Acer negundo TaxID=4023 RepID=A0AAD5J750_ACENE|nr:hypothetical protein LWI28_027589 [Acer negundo]
MVIVNKLMILEWIKLVDYYFACANVENGQQIKLVVCKLRGRAQACWSRVVCQRRKEGKIPVQNWAMMKQLLSKQFLSINFDPILFQQYCNCEQGNKTVLEYGDELYRLSMVLDLEEFEIQWIARFISGLRGDIRDEICLLSLRNLSEAIDLATRIENDLVKEKKSHSRRG